MKTRIVGLPNVLAGEEVVPELLQHHATASQLADAVSECWRVTVTGRCADSTSWRG
ncbi:MAG: hypothetical protein CM15mP92_2000 [Halieaceae bacterium]|nr:MAG: hypothetical protein CM15mP92_2000 [Halieaceae bacterium]